MVRESVDLPIETVQLIPVHTESPLPSTKPLHIVGHNATTWGKQTYPDQPVSPCFIISSCLSPSFELLDVANLPFTHFWMELRICQHMEVS